MASAIRLGHRTSSLVLEVAHNAREVPAYAFSCGYSGSGPAALAGRRVGGGSVLCSAWIMLPRPRSLISLIRAPNQRAWQASLPHGAVTTC